MQKWSRPATWRETLDKMHIFGIFIGLLFLDAFVINSAKYLLLVPLSRESKVGAWKLLPWCYDPLPGEKFSFSEWRKCKFPGHREQNRWLVIILFLRVLFPFYKTVNGGISSGSSGGTERTWIPIHSSVWV